MIVEKMIELLVLNNISNDYYYNQEYANYLDNNYDVSRIEKRYAELGKEFLQEYALNKTEKSD